MVERVNRIGIALLSGLVGENDGDEKGRRRRRRSEGKGRRIYSLRRGVFPPAGRCWATRRRRVHETRKNVRHDRGPIGHLGVLPPPPLPSLPSLSPPSSSNLNSPGPLCPSIAARQFAPHPESTPLRVGKEREKKLKGLVQPLSPPAILHSDSVPLSRGRAVIVLVMVGGRGEKR
ncbi:hypothetical protein ASPWEDRAFT_371781 [Aspergillus wentii DTO 134E9]|uniref:Uncharacterized protein n=1 Tax=Aspergillus wentii DTO 134E9 TaxID=1073089 RepID=A0A1L9RWX9_ASPWE|nr:uncharacterized protein ASPWEDRAFT_371781 [Aspergillus wentii DTO 134E9]OJJ39384.1 hypothetical protein ASPWEDRAFT_371781 [Aspergillus wentii DTO 134E9]